MTMNSRSKPSRSSAGRTGISELLVRRVSEGPTRAAFIEGSGTRSVSWEVIGRHAKDLAIALPVGDGGRRVGLTLDGATQFCSTFLGALACGLCIAPLDPRATHEELRRQVAELSLTDLLLDAPMAGLAGPLLGSGVDVWCVGEPAMVGARTDASTVTSVHRAQVPRANHRTPPGPALVLRTSGSTGRPKLIPLTQAQLLHGAGQVVTHHRLSSDDRGYCPLPLFHINAQVVGILSTLVSGGSLVVDRRLARDRFWQTVEGSGATWLNLVPAILSIVSERPPSDQVSSRVRFARSASSHLAEPVRRRFEETTGIPVLETYGMTEAAGQITANPLIAAEQRPGSVGLPVGVELRVLSDINGSVSVAPQGVVGAVQIKGPSVITAYLAPDGGQPIPACTPDGWLPTGDLAWRDPDGFVYLMGRSDDLINRGGEKLYPVEIEAVLLTDPRVVAASAVGRPHPTLGAEPVAFVVIRPGEMDPNRDLDSNGPDPSGYAQLIQDLHRACSVQLSFYKRPVVITVTDRLPVGATGKVQRSLVRGLVAGATATAT